MTVIRAVAPCSLVEVYRRFRGTAFIIRAMMEAASTSETSVCFYQTTRSNNPDDSHLHTRRREDLKSHYMYSGTEYSLPGLFIFVPNLTSSLDYLSH
jgi:hypothetical protein